MVNHESVVQAAGTLRRIANRLATLSMARILTAPPPLDDRTESAREAVLVAIRARLESWLDLFERSASFISSDAVTGLPGDSRSEIMPPLEEFSSRLEARGFARISSWTLEQRRAILAELQHMRRLQVLMSELDRYLPSVAQPPRTPRSATPQPVPRT
jgi:hypothetical protein